MKSKQFEELVLQSLEHEMGGVEIYTCAIECAVNADLKKEWTKYLKETRSHVAALQEVCAALKIDTATETPGRDIVRRNGVAFVQAMKMALSSGDPVAAELVACECVVVAETKDHLNWELLGKCIVHLPRAQAEALEAAFDKVEDQEDEHLYHSKGWCRELWIQSLGMKPVLPPPEERKHVKTAIGAARAEQSAPQRR